MTRAEYRTFYTSTYRPLVSAYHGRLIDAQTIKEDQKEYAAHLGAVLERVRPDPHPRTLLDIGGSTGIVAADIAQRFGLTATIIDPAPEELDQAGLLGIETIKGFIEDWEPGERTFDMVGMFQTVDHLLDVPRTLEKVRALLGHRGLFVFDIVDFRAAYLRTGSVEEATKIDHPYSLTELTTEALLRRSGFSVVLKSYSPDHLHVLYVCTQAEPQPGSLPERTDVDRHFDELRLVQNARHDL